MEIFKRIQQAIPEFQEQSRIVVDCYGGGGIILEIGYDMVFTPFWSKTN